MTAEIVIMNKEAVALAADSTVTWSGGSDEKTIPSANKLFSLSKYHPVGIMIYQNADFMGVPWETIIKIYREKIKKEDEYDKLEDYANDFLSFLEKNQYFDEDFQEDYLLQTIISHFFLYRKQMLKKINEEMYKQGLIDDSEIKHISLEIIKSYQKLFQNAPKNENVPKNFEKKFIKNYHDAIDNIIQNIFEKLINTNDYFRLREIAISLFCKDVGRSDYSGIVIAGFGKKDIFPKLQAFRLEGIIDNFLKYTKFADHKVTVHNGGAIYPFAQQDMVVRFMDGVDPKYEETERGYLIEMFEEYGEEVIKRVDCYNTISQKRRLKAHLKKISNEIIEDHVKKIKDLKKSEYSHPIVEVVSILPKKDLALMAESLVNLTSLKKKVTMETETVGGPIDVAIISKGDKFIWIKRKHYFNPELNHHFFENYFGGETNG